MGSSSIVRSADAKSTAFDASSTSRYRRDPIDDAHAISAAREENEQMAFEHVVSQYVSHGRHQAVRTLATVDELGGHEQANTRRQVHINDAPGASPAQTIAPGSFLQTHSGAARRAARFSTRAVSNVRPRPAGNLASSSRGVVTPSAPWLPSPRSNGATCELIPTKTRIVSGAFSADADSTSAC
jgi:hypothetical protein